MKTMKKKIQCPNLRPTPLATAALGIEPAERPLLRQLVRLQLQWSIGVENETKQNRKQEHKRIMESEG